MIVGKTYEENYEIIEDVFKPPLFHVLLKFNGQGKCTSD